MVWINGSNDFMVKPVYAPTNSTGLINLGFKTLLRNNEIYQAQDLKEYEVIEFPIFGIQTSHEIES